MKNLKKVAAGIGACSILFLGGNALAKKDISIPDYDKVTKPTVQYFVLGFFGAQPADASIDSPENSNYFKVSTYAIDRNGDGKTDVIEMNYEFSKQVQSDGQGNTSETPGFKINQYIVDDDFDGDGDRILIDSKDMNDKQGADGIPDEVTYVGLMDDYLPK